MDQTFEKRRYQSVAPCEKGAPGADPGGQEKRAFCQKNEAGVCFHEPLFSGVSCPAGMPDQFCDRSNIQTFRL